MSDNNIPADFTKALFNPTEEALTPEQAELVADTEAEAERQRLLKGNVARGEGSTKGFNPYGGKTEMHEFVRALFGQSD